MVTSFTEHMSVSLVSMCDMCHVSPVLRLGDKDTLARLSVNWQLVSPLVTGTRILGYCLVIGRQPWSSALIGGEGGSGTEQVAPGTLVRRWPEHCTMYCVLCYITGAWEPCNGHGERMHRKLNFEKWIGSNVQLLIKAIKILKLVLGYVFVEAGSIQDTMMF